MFYYTACIIAKNLRSDERSSPARDCNSRCDNLTILLEPGAAMIGQEFASHVHKAY